MRPSLRARAGETTFEALDRLGATHLLLVNRLGTGTAESLLAARVEGIEPLEVFTPFRGSAGVEARLPMELDFPLVTLWRLERPGPWIGLYPLD